MAFAKVAALSSLGEARPTHVQVDGRDVCLVRLGDDVHAVLDTCSHEDYPLHEGYVFQGQLECALHGSMFDLKTGDPESLPATTPVPLFAVRVEGDDVLVDVEAPINDAPIPDHA